MRAALARIKRNLLLALWVFRPAGANEPPGGSLVEGKQLPAELVHHILSYFERDYISHGPGCQHQIHVHVRVAQLHTLDPLWDCASNAWFAPWATYKGEPWSMPQAYKDTMNGEFLNQVIDQLELK